ncbi:MAG: hypothetical protein JWQ35_185 [Bacteriovoracaceae bacterium]|nr:hypothetical protein [Bacteriovoracaceae bacterium]
MRRIKGRGWIFFIFCAITTHVRAQSCEVVKRPTSQLFSHGLDFVPIVPGRLFLPLKSRYKFTQWTGVEIDSNDLKELIKKAEAIRSLPDKPEEHMHSNPTQAELRERFLRSELHLLFEKNRTDRLTFELMEDLKTREARYQLVKKTGNLNSAENIANSIALRKVQMAVAELTFGEELDIDQMLMESTKNLKWGIEFSIIRHFETNLQKLQKIFRLKSEEAHQVFAVAVSYLKENGMAQNMSEDYIRTLEVDQDRLKDADAWLQNIKKYYDIKT